MKKTYTLALAGAGLLTLAMGGNALAFHGGGVAHCDGCHSMHNSADNPRAGSATSAALMKGSDASSTCLNCHNGAGRYHIASANGANTNQGGDFFWVAKDYTYDVRGTTKTSLGDNHGHNIVAADFGFAADPTNVTAPGGSMQANTLGCTSCHDPHGQVAGGTSNGTAAISVSGSYGAADPWTAPSTATSACWAMPVTRTSPPEHRWPPQTAMTAPLSTTAAACPAGV